MALYSVFPVVLQVSIKQLLLKKSTELTIKQDISPSLL